MKTIPLWLFGVVFLMAAMPTHSAQESSPSESTSRFPDEDPDNDGISNEEESKRYTDPQDPDTDNDGLWDGSDAIPLSGEMKVSAAPEVGYVVIELDPTYGTPVAVNDNGSVLFTKEDPNNFGVSGTPLLQGTVWRKGHYSSLGLGRKFLGPLADDIVVIAGDWTITEEDLLPGENRVTRTSKSIKSLWTPSAGSQVAGTFATAVYDYWALDGRPPEDSSPSLTPFPSDILNDNTFRSEVHSGYDAFLTNTETIFLTTLETTQNISAEITTVADGGVSIVYSRYFQSSFATLAPNLSYLDSYGYGGIEVNGSSILQNSTGTLFNTGVRSSYFTGWRIDYETNGGNLTQSGAAIDSLRVNGETFLTGTREINNETQTVVGTTNNLTTLPGAPFIIDINESTTSEGPYFIGGTSSSGDDTLLWCFRSGNPFSYQLEHAGTPVPFHTISHASRTVVGRGISNSLVIPMLSKGIWRNSRLVSAKQLLGAKADSYSLVTISQVTPDYNLLLAYGIKNSETIPLLLVPCDIVPDWNRDGVIDNKDRGKVTEEKPWRYWVNDDDDEGDAGGANDKNSDVPEAGVNNGADLVVNGIRDLVDFFPLWLDIKQMLEVLPKAQFDYVLESENNSLQYAETALKKEDSDAYLKAELGEVSERNNPNGLASVAVKTITQGLAKLSDEFLQGITDETGGVLLIEAWKATDKPLKLVVKKKSSGEQMCEFPFHLKIDDVEKMFRHKNIREAVPAWAGRVPGEADRLGEPENYPDDLCINKNFLFVHGYNVNGDQARGWHAEAFKRMFWSGNRARFYGVSWSGDRNQTGYPFLGLRTPNFHHAVYDAFASAQSLAQFVNGLQGGKTIAAHSLGNLMTSAAQSDFGMSVDNFYLVNAAQSIEQHQANAAKSTSLRHGDWPSYQERTFASEWHLLPFPQGDARKNLTWRARVAGHSGQRHNFYSDVSNDLGDHVMRTPSEQTDDDAVIQFNALVGAFLGGAADGSQAFCLQERLKGNFLLPQMGSTWGMEINRELR